MAFFVRVPTGATSTCQPPAAKPAAFPRPSAGRGNRRRAGRSDRERLDGAGLQGARKPGIGFEHERDASAHHVGEHLRGAAGIGDHQQLDAGAALQQFAGQVGEAAGSVGAVGELARPFLGDRDQLRQRRHAERRRGRDEHRRAAEIADRHQIARLEREIGCGAGKRHEGGDRRDRQRVAVGRGRCRGTRCDRAARPRLIDRHDLLAPNLGQPLAHNAQDHINGAAGRGIRDDPNRTGRIVLRLRG